MKKNTDEECMPVDSKEWI